MRSSTRPSSATILPGAVLAVGVLLVVGLARGAWDAPTSAWATAATEDRAPVEASWQSLAPFPERRSQVSAASDGERIYVVGGFVEPGEDHEGLPEAAADMYAYDPSMDRWENLGPIPQPTHHAGLVHVDGRLYLVGGYRDNTFEPLGQVAIYDIVTGEWTEGAPMPTPRGALAYAVLDGRIHTFGGTVADKGGLDPDEHNTDSPDSSVGTHEVYDPESDAWERLSPMPTARNRHAAGTVWGRIYVTAGRAGSDYTMTVTEVWDPAEEGWAEVAPLPTGRNGAAAAVLDGGLYLFGGATFDPGEARTFDSAERYDPGTDRWETLEPMPTARHGLGVGVVDRMIHVVSGGPQPGFAFGDANERYIPPIP